MHKTLRVISIPYALPLSLPIWGDLEGWSRDPMFEKYPSISPYTYCANNPVGYIDPNGEEKINGFDKNRSKGDKKLHASTQNATDGHAIHVFAHGDKKGFVARINQTDEKGNESVKTYRVHNAKLLNEFLSEQSSIWQNRQEGEHITIILHACNTGNGANSFAQNVSSDVVFENVTFVAPDDFYWQSTSGNGTVAPKAVDNNGNVKTDKNDSPVKSTELGKWNYFRKGTLIDAKQGNYNPDAIPDWVSNMLYEFNTSQ